MNWRNGWLVWRKLGWGGMYAESVERLRRRALARDLQEDRQEIEAIKNRGLLVPPSTKTLAEEAFHRAVRSGVVEDVARALHDQANLNVVLCGTIDNDPTLVGIPDVIDGPAGWFLMSNLDGTPRRRTRVHYTALQWAMATANVDLANLLVMNGADVHARNYERRTALMVAAKAVSVIALRWIAPRAGWHEWRRSDVDPSPRELVLAKDPVLAHEIDVLLTMPSGRGAPMSRASEPLST